MIKVKFNGGLSITPTVVSDLRGSLKNCQITHMATDGGDVDKMIEKLCDDSIKLHKLAKFVIETGRVSLEKAKEIMEIEEKDITRETDAKVREFYWAGLSSNDD